MKATQRAATEAANPRGPRHRFALPLAIAAGLAWACAEDAPSHTLSSAHIAPVPVSALPHYELSEEPAIRWKLPGRLREISGLATTSEGRVLAHNDERGTIFELDIDRREIVKTFHLTKGDKRNKGVKGDFEGIAVVADTVFLVTSEGSIFEASEGEDGESVEFEEHDTGIGDRCEVEGLEYEPAGRVLLLACKANPNAKDSRTKEGLRWFRWSIETRRLDDPEAQHVSERELRRALPKGRFHPSGIARHPTSGNYFLLSARDRALIEVSPSGEVLGVTPLAKKRHGHAEGITFVERGTAGPALLISDEGDDKQARLTLYRAEAR